MLLEDGAERGQEEPSAARRIDCLLEKYAHQIIAVTET